MSAPPSPRPRFARLQDILTDLADPRVGIIRYVAEQPRQAGAPDFVRYVAQACDTSAFTPLANFGAASGASVNRDAAIAKAVGEAVERYCAAIFDPDELPLCTARQASFACVDPASFALYGAAQYAEPGFPFRPFRDDTAARWVPALDLQSGARVSVPACFVFVPYRFRLGTGEVPIAQPISTGLAAHGSFAEAALSGLSEVIERDAFTLTWQGRLSRPQIRVESLSAANRDLVERFRVTGYAVTLLDITMDSGVATIMAVCRHTSPDAVPLTFAASAGPDPEEVVAKALEELAHTNRYMHQIKAMTRPVERTADHANINDQLTHLGFWCRAEHAGLADFVFASEQRVDFAELPRLTQGDPSRDLLEVTRRVAATGHRVLVSDLTTDDVRSLGLCVVRVLVPGYHPLFMGHRVRALGGERLWSLPQKLGHRALSRPSGDNPLPHPFP